MTIDPLGDPPQPPKDFHGFLNPSSSAILSNNNYSHLSTPNQSGSNVISSQTTLKPSVELSSHNRHPYHNQYTISQYRSYSKSNDTSPSIDDFRSSEEQKEEEYSKQTQETPPDDNEKRAKIEDAVRKQILEASLRHVAEHGWSRKAIIQGAEDLGLPGVAHGMVADGANALIAHFYSNCNEQLVIQMAAETSNGQKIAEDPLVFLARAIRARLEMILPYKAHWPQALAVMSLPQNVPNSLAQLLTLVDDICFYSGDRSVDFGWYTRRVGIATIYKMVELYMIQDTSPDHQETWVFLKNRLDEAGQLEQVLSHTEGLTNNVQKSFNSAFVTARNMLGLGYDRR